MIKGGGPDFDFNVLAPRQSRLPQAWLLVGLVFALLIWMTLSQVTNQSGRDGPPALSPPVDGPSTAAGQEFHLTEEEALRRLASLKPAQPPTVEDLRQLVMLKAAARQDFAQDLRDLRSADKSPVGSALRAIYGTSQLSASRRRQLLAALPSGAEYDPARHALADKSAAEPPQLAVALALLFAVGLGFWILYVQKRVAGKWTPKGHPLKLTPPEADRVAMRFVLAFIGFNFAMLLGAMLMPSELRMWRLLTGSLASLGIVLASFSVLVHGFQVRLSSLFADVGRWREHVLWGFGAMLANVPVLLLLGLVAAPFTRYLPSADHPAMGLLQGGTVALVTTVIALSVLAPITEELLFRGLLFPALGTVLGSPLRGALVSSLLFASLHPQGPALWLALGSVGFMAAMVTHQTGSILPAMVLHSLNNTLVTVMALAVNS